MKIAYIANIRIPTEKAHGYQIVKVCEGLASVGLDVDLIVPNRVNTINADPFDYYGSKRNFKLTKISSFDAVRFTDFLGPLAFLISQFLFLRSISIPKDVLVFTRDHRIAKYFSSKGFSVVYNAHNWKSSRAYFLKKVKGVVCNSKGTAESVRKNILIPLVVVPNATDANPWVDHDKSILRKDLLLPSGKIALYTGHLYEWKGVSTIYSLAQNMQDINFVFVGGTKKALLVARKNTSHISNLYFLGHKNHREVFKYLVAADVLLLPNTAKSEESLSYTSPMKLFEYMASKNPIIASDLPSIRNIVSEDMVSFFEPDNPTSLGDQIQFVFRNANTASKKAEEAFKEVSKYTWSNHAKTLYDFFLSIS